MASRAEAKDRSWNLNEDCSFSSAEITPIRTIYHAKGTSKSLNSSKERK